MFIPHVLNQCVFGTSRSQKLGFHTRHNPATLIYHFLEGVGRMMSSRRTALLAQVIGGLLSVLIVIAIFFKGQIGIGATILNLVILAAIISPFIVMAANVGPDNLEVSLTCYHRIPTNC